MEDNKIVIFKKPDISNNEELSGVIVEKSKRKIKKKKKKWIFVLILLAGLIASGIVFREKLVDLFEKIRFSTDEGETEDSLQDENNNKNNISNEAKPKEDYFINTSPGKFEIINESKHDIYVEGLTYSLPTAKEIYTSFSTTSPVVLITAFSPKEAYYKGDGSAFYSDERNTYDMGKAICDMLNASGVNAICLNPLDHNGSLYDSKLHYENAVKEILTSNPSISYIFDISRGLTLGKDNMPVKETVTVGNASFPTITLINGTGEGLPSECKLKGIYFASCVAKTLNQEFGSIVSKQVISKYSLSQDFDVPTVRVDIGSFPCTYEEAMGSAKLFSECVSKLLSE